MKINKKKIIRLLKILVIIYCGLGIALYYLQDYFLFHPKHLTANHSFKFNIRFKELQIPFNKNDTMSLIKFFPSDSISRGVILYYHGNKDNIERYAPFVQIFTRRGYEVWMEDYPGFGKSRGKRNEQKLYEQAWQVYRMATGSFPPDQITIYGKSFGTGIAAYVASASKCRQLILETPYFSMPDLFAHYAWMYPTSLMVKYKLPTWEFLTDVQAPVVIFHGTKDKIIPYQNALKLKPYLKRYDGFITIADGRHNNLAQSERYINTIDSLLK